MITHVKLDCQEVKCFNFLSGMIGNISPLLKEIQQRGMSENELRTLKCSLVQLKEDAAKCEVLVNSGVVFLEKQNGKDR